MEETKQKNIEQIAEENTKPKDEKRTGIIYRIVIGPTYLGPSTCYYRPS